MAGCSVCGANCLTLFHQHQKSLESHSLMCQPLFTKTPWRQRTRTSLPPLQKNLHLLKSSWWLLGIDLVSLWALPVSVLFTICTRCFRFPAVRLNIPRDWLGWKLYKTWIKVISSYIVYIVYFIHDVHTELLLLILVWLLGSTFVTLEWMNPVTYNKFWLYI